MDASETLNQADIDRLLASAAEAERSPVFRHDGTSLGTTTDVEINPVDFRNPTLLAEADLRRLRAQHQEFVRALGSRISAFLRAEIGLTLSRFSTQSYESFIETVKSPAHLSLFRVAPLSGVGVLEIPPRLGIGFTNRILGGREQAPEQDVYLTEIEVALLEDVISIVCEEWCRVWKDHANLTPELIGHETNPRFVQACAKNAPMLVVGVDVAFGQAVETMQIGVPMAMIDPMIKRMLTARSREVGGHRHDSVPAWQDSYYSIPVPVIAELDAGTYSIADVLALEPGKVIVLPFSRLSEARVRLANSPGFIGKAGQKDGRIAVHIETKISK